jgi:hypothetical protein
VALGFSEQLLVPVLVVVVHLINERIGPEAATRTVPQAGK